MKNPDYQKPIVRVVKTKSVHLLTGTNKSLNFNPNQGTTEALGRESGRHWLDEDE
jgi:hypothetical protein